MHHTKGSALVRQIAEVLWNSLLIVVNDRLRNCTAIKILSVVFSSDIDPEASGRRHSYFYVHWTAAYFTVLYVMLVASRFVYKNRNCFSTIGTV